MVTNNITKQIPDLCNAIYNIYNIFWILIIPLEASTTNIGFPSMSSMVFCLLYDDHDIILLYSPKKLLAY